MHEEDRIIKRVDLIRSLHVVDELHAIAYNIEDVFLRNGAKPGIDYTYRDLLTLAQPFVVEMFRQNEHIKYEYPADKIEEPPWR